MTDIVYKDGVFVGFRLREPSGPVFGPPIPRLKELRFSEEDIEVHRHDQRDGAPDDDCYFWIDGGNPDYDDPDGICLSRKEAEIVLRLLRQAIDAPEEWP